MYNEPQLLFMTGELRVFFDRRTEKLNSDIKSMSYQDITNEETHASLLRRYVVPLIELDATKSHADVRETTTVVNDSFMGRRGQREATEVTYNVPFTGEAELFTLRPGTYNLNPPRGEVSGTVLRVRSTFPKTVSPTDVEKWFREVMANVQWYVEQINTGVGQYNGQLGELVKQGLLKRRSDLDLMRQLSDELNGTSSVPESKTS